MEPVDMTYNLCSMEEPTENQLQQIIEKHKKNMTRVYGKS
jgi:hypothetical protein